MAGARGGALGAGGGAEARGARADIGAGAAGPRAGAGVEAGAGAGRRRDEYIFRPENLACRRLASERIESSIPDYPDFARLFHFLNIYDISSADRGGYRPTVPTFHFEKRGATIFHPPRRVPPPPWHELQRERGMRPRGARRSISNRSGSSLPSTLCLLPPPTETAPSLPPPTLPLPAFEPSAWNDTLPAPPANRIEWNNPAATPVHSYRLVPRANVTAH